MMGKGSGKGAGKPDIQAFLATLTWLTTLAGMEEITETASSSSQEGSNHGTSGPTSSSSQQGTNRGTPEATRSASHPDVAEPEMEPLKPRLAPEAPEHDVKMEHGKLRGMPYWKVLLDRGYCKWILEHITATSTAQMQDLLAYVKEYYKLVPKPGGRGTTLMQVSALPTMAQGESAADDAPQHPSSIASDRMRPVSYDDMWRAAYIMSVATPQMLQSAAWRVLRESGSQPPQMEQMIAIVEIVANYHSVRQR